MRPELEVIQKKEQAQKKPIEPTLPTQIGVGEEYMGELRDKPKVVNVDKRILKLYFIPILAIVFFFLFNILVIIPKINNMINDMGIISEKNGTLSSKKKNIVNLEKSKVARSDKISTDLGVINSLAPAGQTQVVEYQNKISNLANQYNLKIISQRTSDGFIIETGKELKEVPTEFEMTGSISDIRIFVEEIGKLNDFVVVKSLSLTESITAINTNDADSISAVETIETAEISEVSFTSEWSLGISLVKYQFANPSEALTSTYLSIPIETALPQSLQSYIDARLGIIDNSLTFE